MKYLFFDIDGTLVSRKLGLVPSAKKAIDLTRQKGNKVFLSTGRHLGALFSVQDLEVDGVIYCNGGGIMIDNEIVCIREIPHDICSKTVFQAEEREGRYSLMTSDKLFKNKKEMDFFIHNAFFDDRYKDKGPEEKIQAFGAHPFTDYRHEPILKIDIGFDTEEIMEDFEKHMSEDLQLASTAGYHIELGKRSGEITRKGVNKGTAIQQVVSHFGGSMDDTFGFGDSNNDLEMLQMCHTGIAMGNAFEEIKQIADFITEDTDHDGIYKAMEHFDLI